MHRRAFLKHATWATFAGRYGAAARKGDTRVRLITRGDDLGCAHSLNRAMKECFEKGILKNCSVLAPAPYLEEGVKMLAKAKGLCFGLHSALTSEWDSRRWAPVAPREKSAFARGRKGFSSSE